MPELARWVARWVARWALVPDGAVIATPSSVLLPVRHEGAPAMLKVAHAAEERAGAALMAWWGGDGAARVLAHEEDALLLERAVGASSLAAMARTGGDDAATRVLCATAARLHAPRASAPPPSLVPLARWFAALEPAASAHGGILAASAEAAGALLADPRDVVVLHGDLHHDNVLDGGPRGWLAIDPKGLVGERGFDFANVFCNPGPDVALAPGRLARQAHVVAHAAHVERPRLFRWILAYAGLSTAWSIADGESAETALGVAALAAAELDGGE